MLRGNMEFLQWSCDDVARWIESLGFPQYKACFTENCITGRKLIYVNCIYMPRLGIRDFKDMKLCCTVEASNQKRKEKKNNWPLLVICAGVRELLGITETPWSRNIADPPRDSMGLFLEKKSRTGELADNLTYQQFLDDMHPSERHESQQ
ncbi:sterile alpha motif domain-containing protein 15 isoform X1 [Perca flavescens]|uniref:sterile alpha motif domain-containing protein 15 isoform X1 n=1 Tax=Perca flavescens TaxID=8167 RepID=UPI00106E7C9A|nr:sterile alpha motif domain-containing protein 15-like isoform X1 [Perca flavescens]